MKNFRLDKKNLLIILILLLITIVLNHLLFSKQLNYGFRDVDWLVLYYFKLFGDLSLNHLLQEAKELGVYVTESYYTGFLEKIIGLNFAKLHQVTHLFKIAAGISIYILILKIFKRKLLAFISSILYSISYTHAGVLFQLSSGGYFLTTMFMVAFLILYYLTLYKKDVLKLSMISGAVLIITLLLKPERMYPLVALVLFVEFFIVICGKNRRYLLTTSVKRMFFVFLPFLIFSLFYQMLVKEIPAGFSSSGSGTVEVPGGLGTSQFMKVAKVRIGSIAEGNLQLLTYPFASLGSLFLYEDYWKKLGQLNFQKLEVLILSLAAGPILRLGIITFILLSFIYKKPVRLTSIIMTSIFVFGLTIYGLNINWQHINTAVRIHFDPNFIAMPAIFGFYIFILGCTFFIKWFITKDQALMPLIVGICFAVLFILLTWIPSDIQLVFMGPQRYLSIPSIGTSLFLAGLLVIVFDKLRKIKSVKHFAWIIFLILGPVVIINWQVANKFFENELIFAGQRASEQTRMKNRFRELVGEISKEDKSLFYFDETADKDNGYFDEATVVAGFEFWTRVNMDGSLNNFPEPGMIRTNIQCPEHTHQNCIDILKSGLAVVDGRKGIWYKDPIRGNKDRFYPLTNFYAVRFINKDITNITKEVLREIGEVSQVK